jgi:V-type H+-transporting ATPase subunit H
MLVQKVLQYVKSLSNRKWSDDDVVEDINYLKSELQERLEGLT